MGGRKSGAVTIKDSAALVLIAKREVKVASPSHKYL
jgi:hypothetical protein